MPTLNTMFNESANTMFNNMAFNCGMMRDMSEQGQNQIQRLYQAAKDLHGVEGKSGKSGKSAVARFLNTSPQTLNNWEDRGISDEGLLLAQEKIGCDALWLRDGAGDMVRGEPKRSRDLSDITELVAIYNLSDDEERRAILEFARDTRRAREGGGDAVIDNKL